MKIINFLKEFKEFILERKLLLIAPIIIFLIIIGLLLIFSTQSAVAPFIYTIF
jgi:flagellar biosynthesis/type III secretory pathway M-ring protein FliF/YscJ